MISYLITTFAVALGINVAMFIPAFFLKTDKLTDISYAATFATIALFALWQGTKSTATILLTIMILLWAIRLGSYLLIRIHKMGRDKRFDGMREDFLKFARFWFFQGITVWVVLLPSIYFYQAPNTNINVLTIVGLMIWLVGLTVETIADMQKFQFINNPANKGQWIASGIWKYSRHPNYFGEITHWVGIYIFTVGSLTSLQAVTGLASPLYITSILLFVSGLPMLEKVADERWGDNPEYQKYKAQTSAIIPLPPKTK